MKIKKNAFALFAELKYFCLVIQFSAIANEQHLISSIEQNVKKLIDANKKLKQENLNLHQHINELNSDIEKLKNEIEIKRNDLFKITLANTLKTEQSVEDSKEKIDELLSEIDRCIQVLSE